MNFNATRRNFLGAAAGAAGLAAVGIRPASAEIVPEPWGIKLGICTYTFRKFDRAKAIEYIKQLHTPWVSVKQDPHLKLDLTGADLRAAAEEFRAAGLKLMSAGNTDMKETTVDGLRPIFEWAKTAQIPMLVAAPRHENLDAIEKLIKEYNIKVAIHNHGPEDKNFPTPESVLEAVKGRDPRFGLCMDVGHSARTGANVVQAIAQAGPRLLDMHVKDLKFFKDNNGGKDAKNSQCDVGDGIMPFPAIFKQLKKMNYQGCVDLEYEIHDTDPMPGVERSFAYMRGVLAGLAAG